ncbi:MAG TPA: DinB family protein [Ktedonobacterales bacterium]
MDITPETYELALGVLAATLACLRALLEPISPDVWQAAPAPGEWSLYETLAHLLHVETAVIPARLRQMLATDGAPLTSAEQEAAPSAPEAALAAWQAARRENLAFLHSLSPADLARAGEHPRYGRITAREHIIEWAYHDLEHMRQLQATLEARLYPGIGGFRALYSAPYPPVERPD